MAGYPEALLQSGERVLEHHRPHWRMLVVPALLPPLLAAPVGFVAAVSAPHPWASTAWIALGVVVAALLWWFSLAPVARWRCTHLVVTDRRVLVREGVVSRAGIELAAEEISEVRVRQRVAERALGCGTLLVATVGEARRWEFDGIPHLARVAATVEQIAEDHGGLTEAGRSGSDDPEQDADGWSAWDDEDDRGRALRTSR